MSVFPATAVAAFVVDAFVAAVTAVAAAFVAAVTAVATAFVAAAFVVAAFVAAVTAAFVAAALVDSFFEPLYSAGSVVYLQMIPNHDQCEHHTVHVPWMQLLP